MCAVCVYFSDARANYRWISPLRERLTPTRPKRSRRKSTKGSESVRRSRAFIYR